MFLSCLLKDGKEVNAVMLVGRLFHARATVTRNDRSPMVLSRVRGTIRRVIIVVITTSFLSPKDSCLSFYRNFDVGI